MKLAVRFTAHLDSHATVDTKLMIYFENDPCALMSNAVTFVSLNEQAREIYIADYEVTNYLQDVYNHLGRDVYNEVMTEVYGQSGQVKEVLSLNELYLYGSARLGAINADTLIHYREYDGELTEVGLPMGLDSVLIDSTPVAIDSYATRYTGRKHYEITNHLGNVLAIVSDRKMPCDTPANSFKAEVIEANDYYAFGSEMKGRGTVSSEPYSFGFNTQQRSPEISIGHTTALFWEYDGRLARRWNVDPKTNPSISSYATFGNNPIILIDVLGDTTYRFNKKTGNYIGMYDLDATGSVGSYGNYKTIGEGKKAENR